jgi:hypothetical protein
MRILTLGILLLAMGGCATAAEQEMTRMRDTTERAGAVTESCWSRMQAQDGYAELSARLALKIHVPPTLAQRADASRPTAEERRALSALHRDWLTPCRTAMIDGLVAALPALHRSLILYAEREDAVYAALVQGRLTWGDANTQLVVLRRETADATREITSQVTQSLHEQHAHEMAHRAAALSALGDAMMEFASRRAEAERQRQQSTSRQIICQNVGGFLHCTTF